MGERSKRYVLQSLFVSFPRARGGKYDLRKLILHLTALGGKDGCTRGQLNPCPVVGRLHGVQLVGTKERCELLKGHTGTRRTLTSGEAIAGPREKIATDHAT